MINFDQIRSELLLIDNYATRHTEHLDRERGYIIEAMNKAQETFGDQEAGQNLVITLSYVINNLVSADSAIYHLKSDIHEYIQQIQK